MFSSTVTRASRYVVCNHIVGKTVSELRRRIMSAASASRDISAITSHYAEVNGVRLHYEKTGVGKHALILLPGTLGSTRTDYTPQLKKLNKEKYTIYSFDPRGCGRSIPPERDWPLRYPQRDAEDAVALMKTLEPKRWSVLGWSAGGMMGLIVAGNHPELVRRLVVWNTQAYVLPSQLELWRHLADFSTWSPAMRDLFVEVYGMDYLQRQFNSWLEVFEENIKKSHGDVCVEETKKVRCPTLIIHGQKDPLVTQERSDFIHQTIPGSVLVNWPNGKHNLHFKYVDEFNSLVEDFLDQDDEESSAGE